MGFLDNSTTTVDAILTTRGRELLSSGEGLNITKFALSDEEVDYTLFDVTHPNGTDSYGSVIENMNLLEYVKPLQNELRQLLNIVGVSSMEEYMKHRELMIETNEEKIAFLLGQMAMIDTIIHAMILDEETEELLELEEE
jgi:hypothetical protein